MSETNLTLEDALIVLRRRLMYFLVPFLLLAPIGLLAVMLIPPAYTAKGVILVESQQIPQELIRSTVSAYVQERVEVIKQRVITRSRMLEIADKYSLFPSSSGFSETDRVNLMRKALEIEYISTKGENDYRPTDGTIAFTVAFTDESPSRAVQISNEFMTLFLSEDARARSVGATNTTAFFRQESDRIRSLIDALESKIATFKEENADALPENMDLMKKLLSDATTDLTTTVSTIQALEDERRALENQLAVSVSTAGSADGQGQELQRLRSQLAALRADRTDSHPDIIALRQQIASLERQQGPSASVTRLRQALQRADEDLRKARAVEPPNEAQVSERLAAVNAARAALNAQVSREMSSGAGNLLATQFVSRIDVISSRIEALTSQSDELRAKVRTLEANIARVPSVERGLSTLLRDYENLTADYKQLQAKQQEAIISENLQANQKGEKFSVLEPAVQPELPTSPERAKLGILVVLAAGFVGVIAAFGAEFFLAAIRGRDHLTNLAGEPPLAVIPYIKQGAAARKAASQGKTVSREAA